MLIDYLILAFDERLAVKKIIQFLPLLTCYVAQMTNTNMILWLKSLLEEYVYLEKNIQVSKRK